MDQTLAGGGLLQLDPAFHGTALRDGDLGYDEARAVYNGMIDRRPSLVVRPAGAADVVDAVRLAGEHGLPVGVRCGGHQVAGLGTCDGGVLVDLSSLKGVHVDPVARRARVNGGELWGELDRETQLFGLATPGGRVTTTGVGGFTLGGGYGWISTKFGLACDNLVSADVVTADGRLVTASESENPELLWALRGGGGNFGVVTSYEFALHPVGPTVLAGMLIHPLERGHDVVAAWREQVEQAPDELATALAVVMAPPEPFVPEAMVGVPVLGMIVMWVGDVSDGESELAALRRIGPPLMDLVQPMPYTAFQGMLDGFAPKGWRNYHRGVHLSGLPDEAADAFLAHGEQTLSPMNQAILFRMGGAVTRMGEGSAAGHRHAPYMAHPIAAWQTPEEDAANIAWARAFTDALTPWAEGIYLNFEQTGDEAMRRSGYDSETWDRLVAVKTAWDPQNMFCVNHNVPPGPTVPGPRPAP